MATDLGKYARENKNLLEEKEKKLTNSRKKKRKVLNLSLLEDEYNSLDNYSEETGIPKVVLIRKALKEKGII